MNIDQVDIQSHQPVLIKSLIDKLPVVKGIWVDCTFGNGGYSEALLKAGAKKIIGIDRDPTISCRVIELKARYGSKLEVCEAKFSTLDKVVSNFGIKKIAGVVFDVGVSSMQIDNASRGFSFQKNGPLDMRMSLTGITASDIVNNASEEELANIIFNYGEDRSARLIARAIVKERVTQQILSTRHLSDIINKLSRKFKRRNKNDINPATRTFQALRIAVNDELAELNYGLTAAERVLDVDGVLAVVTFHSLEDRLVKQFLKSRSRTTSGQSRYFPERQIALPRFRELSNKVIKASDEEISFNPRARSAKLRIAIKLPFSEKQSKVEKVNFPKVKFSTGLN